MKQKSVVQSIRFSVIQIEKIAWLKTKKINPAHIVRKGFDSEFERFIKQFEQEHKHTNKLPF
jgi:hypothetical protein